ncbi:LysR substrate-binding domain-containing protein [Siccirubricoccus deserti]
MPQLLARLAAEAPGLRVMVRALPDWRRGAELLDAGAVDLCIGIAGGEPPRPWHRRRTLWDEGFLSLFAPARLGVQAPLSLDDFLARQHVLAIPREGVLEGRTDQALARIGRRRRIVLSTPQYLALPHLLLAAPLVATLHARPARFLAAAHEGLATSPVPVEVPPIEEAVVWHEATDRDPAQRWFRNAVAAVAEGLAPP